MKIPLDLCINNTLKGLETKLFITLKKQSEEVLLDTFTTNLLDLMRVLNLQDKRTIQKVISRILNADLVIQESALQNSNELTLSFNNEVVTAYEINKRQLELLQSISPDSIKMGLFYLYFFYQYNRKPTNVEMKSHLQLGSNKLSEGMRELKESGFIYEIANVPTRQLANIITPNIDTVLKKVNPEQNILSEAMLEKVIAANLEKIEVGLTLIKTQVKIKEGIIDILAKDKLGTLCIIELKVVPDDEKLVFQSVYYPTQLIGNVRMITIAPDYSYKIKTSLKKLGYVEMKVYRIEDDKIEISDFKAENI